MRVDCCPLHFSNHSINLISRYQGLLLHFIDFKFHCFEKMQNYSLNSKDSDIFDVVQSLTELSLGRNTTTETLNSTELSGAPAREHITLWSVASSEPQLITIHSDSNGPTIPYGYGRQDPIVPPSLNDLNLPANTFNILATVEVVHPTAVHHDDNYSPQSPEPSDPSPISTPPMTFSTIEGWETPHTTTDDNTFFSDKEPRRTYFLPSSPSPPPPLRKLRRKMSSGRSSPRRRGVSQHVCEAWGQTLPAKKKILGPSTD